MPIQNSGEMSKALLSIVKHLTNNIADLQKPLGIVTVISYKLKCGYDFYKFRAVLRLCLNNLQYSNAFPNVSGVVAREMCHQRQHTNDTV